MSKLVHSVGTFSDCCSHALSLQYDAMLCVAMQYATMGFKCVRVLPGSQGDTRT